MGIELTVGEPIQAGAPGFPEWAEGYWAVRKLDDGRWLTWGPLWPAGRSRIGIATEAAPGTEFW